MKCAWTLVCLLGSWYVLQKECICSSFHQYPNLFDLTWLSPNIGQSTHKKVSLLASLLAQVMIHAQKLLAYLLDSIDTSFSLIWLNWAKIGARGGDNLASIQSCVCAWVKIYTPQMNVGPSTQEGSAHAHQLVCRGQEICWVQGWWVPAEPPRQTVPGSL